MDIDRLISMVFERRSLWDRNHKLHGDRQVTMRLWKEISFQMKEDETKLRKKWRYLRDQYSIERKLQATRSTIPKWPYFNALLFLKDIVQPRTHTVSLVRALAYPPVHTEDIDEASDSQESHDNPLIGHDTSTSTLGHYEEDLSSIPSTSKRILKRSLKQMSKEDDEHLLFFKSLLPHVRKIPQHKILSFRNHIQNVVDEFAYRPQMALEAYYASGEKNSVNSGCRRQTDASPEYQSSTMSDTGNIAIKEELDMAIEDES